MNNNSVRGDVTDCKQRIALNECLYNEHAERQNTQISMSLNSRFISTKLFSSVDTFECIILFTFA